MCVRRHLYRSESFCYCVGKIIINSQRSLPATSPPNSRARHSSTFESATRVSVVSCGLKCECSSITCSKRVKAVSSALSQFDRLLDWTTWDECLIRIDFSFSLKRALLRQSFLIAVQSRVATTTVAPSLPFNQTASVSINAGFRKISNDHSHRI